MLVSMQRNKDNNKITAYFKEKGSFLRDPGMPEQTKCCHINSEMSNYQDVEQEYTYMCDSAACLCFILGTISKYTVNIYSASFILKTDRSLCAVPVSDFLTSSPPLCCSLKPDPVMNDEEHDFVLCLRKKS